MSSSSELSSQLIVLQQRMLRACRAANRSSESVRLMAVSKGQPLEKIQDLFELGVRDFGENYQDELSAKAKALAHLPIHWHFIGQLQSNKIQKIMEVAQSIHSVASSKHARYVDRYAKEMDKSSFPIFISVNIGQESTKGGVAPGAALALAAEIQEHCPNLRLQGVMAIPPVQGSASDPLLYSQLRQLASEVGEGLLSLGMSDDLETAIMFGSDMVRVGTFLFGARGL